MLTPDLVDLNAHVILRKCARLIDAGLYDWIVAVEPKAFRSDDGAGDTCHGSADYFHRKITLDASFCAKGQPYFLDVMTHEISHALLGARSNNHGEEFEQKRRLVRKVVGELTADWNA